MSVSTDKNSYSGLSVKMLKTLHKSWLLQDWRLVEKCLWGTAITNFMKIWHTIWPPTLRHTRTWSPLERVLLWPQLEEENICAQRGEEKLDKPEERNNCVCVRNWNYCAHIQELSNCNISCKLLLNSLFLNFIIVHLQCNDIVPATGVIP